MQIKKAYFIVESLYKEANAPIDAFQESKDLHAENDIKLPDYGRQEISRAWLCAVVYPLFKLKHLNIATAEHLAAYDVLVKHAKYDRKMDMSLMDNENWWFGWSTEACKIAFEALLSTKTNNRLKSGKMTIKEIKDMIMVIEYILPDLSFDLYDIDEELQEWWYEEAERPRRLILSKEVDYSVQNQIEVVSEIWNKLLEKIDDFENSEELSALIRKQVMPEIVRLEEGIKQGKY